MEKEGEGDVAGGPPVPTREELLRDELDRVVGEIASSKKQLTELRDENELLQREAARIRSESHEYMSFVDKRVEKRKKFEVTLEAFYQKEIEKLAEEKAKMLADYASRKEALQRELLEAQFIYKLYTVH